MKTIGDRVVTYRTSRRWTQKYLASRAGLTQSQLSNIENDRVSPTWRTLARIAAQLEIPVIQLLPSDDHEYTPEYDPGCDNADIEALWERLLAAKEKIIMAQEETIKALLLQLDAQK